MKLNAVHTIALATAFGYALCSGVPLQAQNKVQVLYVIPKNEKPRPYAAQAAASIMSLVQQHYLQQLGRTFELADPLVTTAFSDKTAAEAVDWNVNVDFVKRAVPDGYIDQQNIVVTIIEGSEGSAGGSYNITKMTGTFWAQAYDAFIDTPYRVPLHFGNSVLAFSHELGHALGLQHTDRLKPCMADAGVNIPLLGGLIMYQDAWGDRGSMFNFSFLPEEKRLLLDPNYQQQCRAYASETGAPPRPHPTAFLHLNAAQPFPVANSRNVNRLEAASGDRVVAYYKQLGPRAWKEFNAQGQPTFSFRETGRDANAVTLFDSGRNVYLYLDLTRRKIVYQQGGSKFDLYDIWNPAADVNGWTATYIVTGKATANSNNYAKSAWVQVREGVWQRQSLNGNVLAEYQESPRAGADGAGRDDWSVYLEAPGRTPIFLDLFQKRVRLISNGAPVGGDEGDILYADTIAPLARQRLFAQ